VIGHDLGLNPPGRYFHQVTVPDLQLPGRIPVHPECILWKDFMQQGIILRVAMGVNGMPAKDKSEGPFRNGLWSPIRRKRGEPGLFRD